MEKGVEMNIIGELPANLIGINIGFRKWLKMIKLRKFIYFKNG